MHNVQATKRFFVELIFKEKIDDKYCLISIVSLIGTLLNRFSTSNDANVSFCSIWEWRICKNSLVELIVYLVKKRYGMWMTCDMIGQSGLPGL